MSREAEERGVNREKIKRIVILLVTGLLAYGGGVATMSALAPAASIPSEIKLVMPDKPMRCIVDPITIRQEVVPWTEKVKK